MKKLIAVFILSFGSFTVAQDTTRGNVYFGYSYSHFAAKNINGWNTSVEGRLLPVLGVVADFNGAYTSDQRRDALSGQLALDTKTKNRIHTFLFGPRVHVRVGRLRPFGHVLLGVARYYSSFDHLLTNDGVVVPEGTYHFSGSTNRFALALGGGSDVRFARSLDWRIQADYVRVAPWQSDGSNNARVSTGLVLRF